MANCNIAILIGSKCCKRNVTLYKLDTEHFVMQRIIDNACINIRLFVNNADEKRVDQKCLKNIQ